MLGRLHAVRTTLDSRQRLQRPAWVMSARNLGQRGWRSKTPAADCYKICAAGTVRWQSRQADKHTHTHIRTHTHTHTHTRTDTDTDTHTHTHISRHRHRHRHKLAYVPWLQRQKTAGNSRQPVVRVIALSPWMRWPDTRAQCCERKSEMVEPPPGIALARTKHDCCYMRLYVTML